MHRSIPLTLSLAAALFALTGCATLAVTPLQAPKPVAAKQPISIGVQAAGERLREVLASPTDSTMNALPAQAKVMLLPPEAAVKSPAEIAATYGTDYLYATNISDISVAGNLNPIWFASIPLFFFKPYVPIVTFESVVTLDNSIIDTHTGRTILQRQSTAVATDHFSPMTAQEKVRGLVSRSINNAVVSFLDEFREKVASTP